MNKLKSLYNRLMTPVEVTMYDMIVIYAGLSCLVFNLVFKG